MSNQIRVIVAGSRSFSDYNLLSEKLTHYFSKTPYSDITIISGTASGADKLGERFAQQHNIKLEKYPADWNTHGKSAGYIRNTQMAKLATHCICFHDGTSRGTQHMIDIATNYNLILRVVKF